VSIEILTQLGMCECRWAGRESPRMLWRGCSAARAAPEQRCWWLAGSTDRPAAAGSPTMPYKGIFEALTGPGSRLLNLLSSCGHGVRRRVALSCNFPPAPHYEMAFPGTFLAFKLYG